jgi:hydroxyethylthiazole kinase-like uncharacterized protein yjeF
VIGLKLQGGVAFLTAEEMAEADRYAIEVLGISVDSLMENAGTKTAEVARLMLGGDVKGKKVEVLVGRGNNGGDGLVAARHLHNWGCEVIVVLGEDRSTMRDVPARQLSIVEKMGVEIAGADAALEAELLIDALLGYGSKGNPREPLSGLISRTKSSKVPVLAVDIPSGLDATTGEPGEPSMAAKATVTFGLPKSGFLGPRARALIGDLYVADISLPSAIYEKYSSQGMFAWGSLVRIW